MSFIQGDFVSVPKPLTELAVFHINRRPIEEINACYRALFDACNIEQACGNDTRYSDHDTFFKYLTAERINYKALKVVVNSIPALAQEHLGINLFCVNSGGYFTDTPFPRDLGQGVSAAESAQIISEAMIAQHEVCEQKINKLLSNTSKDLVIIHFFYATGTSLVLISLVQTKQSRAFFVCNEDNVPLGRFLFGTFIPCSVMTCVTGLAKKFAISSFEDFKSKKELTVTFPYTWPSIPQTFVEKGVEKIDPIIRVGKALASLAVVGVSVFGIYKAIRWMANADMRRVF